MEENQLKEIIKHGESDTIEFKKKLSSLRNLAVLIASFGNSYGGKILIGITNKSKVRGVENLQETISKIKDASNLMAPILNPYIEVVEIYGKNVIVVDVEPSNKAPHAVQGAYYKRTGRFSSLATIEQLENIIDIRVNKSNNSVNVLKEQIHQLLVQNAELYKSFKVSQSMKSKMVDYVIGAAVGAAFSIVLQLFF